MSQQLMSKTTKPKFRASRPGINDREAKLAKPDVTLGVFSASDRALALKSASLSRLDAKRAETPAAHKGYSSRRRKPGPTKLKPLVQPGPHHFDEPPDCHPPATLLEYDHPQYVGDTLEECGPLPGIHERTSAPDLEDMVNAMLPPREWTELTGTWMQYVSKRPATREDLTKLSERLDALLREHQAKPRGVCDVRSYYFAQLFDELIRQVTLEEPLLGLVLMRVRDEGRMHHDATLCVHDSGYVFGLEEMVKAAPGMEELHVRVRELAEENLEIAEAVVLLQKRAFTLEKNAAELRAIKEKEDRQEIEDYKFQGQHLDGLIRLFQQGPQPGSAGGLAPPPHLLGAHKGK